MVRTSALFLLCSVAASAQLTLPYSETFDGGGIPPGWTFTDGSLTVLWDVDALPSSVGPGPDGPTFGGSAGSMNYNDDVDYDDGAANFGFAFSPAIDVSTAGGVVTISFQCNYETEDSGTTFDVRTMDVFDFDTGGVIASYTFAESGDSSPPETTCSAMGTFHLHTLTVDVGASTSIQISFGFDCGDAGVNMQAGWFVDNLSVQCSDTTPPPAPDNVSPPDGTLIPGPAPVAVDLDWTDVADTSACGPGSVANYVVEVDTTDPPVAPFVFTGTPTSSAITTSPLPSGVYFWRVRAVDGAGNVGPSSAVTSFEVESPMPPTAPDALHVNTQVAGSQSGLSGTVSDLDDRFPVLSAVFHDPNTVDAALQFRYQLARDPLFVEMVFDSGFTPLSPPVDKDARCPDQAIPLPLDPGGEYSWRCQFADSSGLVSPFSAPQTFSIAERETGGGRSSKKTRSCFVATATWGADSSQTTTLVVWRAAVVERAAAGRAFCRAYAGAGPGAAKASRSARAPARLVIGLLSAGAGPSGAGSLLLFLGVLGMLLRRLRRSP